MARTNVNDVATAESRAKGGHAKAAKLRERREKAEQLALDKLVSSLDSAIDRIVAALDADATVYSKDGDVHVAVDHGVRLKAAQALIDRILGKASQRHEHTGRVELDVEVAQVRERLNDRIADRARRRRP